MTAIFRFWKWIFYFLIISCSFVLDGVGQACDRERDSLALVDLYNATGGENWTYTKTTYWDALSSQIQPIPNIGKIWDFDAPINTWYGIEVNQNRCVTKLILPSCGLVGELSSKIGELSDLSGLHINGNSLTGEIPKELGLLSNLNILELRNNRLTGEIPIELGNLSNLIELSIGVNDFDGALPFELGNLSNLRWFSAFFCGLKGEIPKSIGNMVSLENIDLSSNSLSGHIPIEIKNLLKLKGIFFSSNNLIGNIPSELGALNNLEALLLSRNAFSESIPKELGNLPNLTRIDISFNQLNGCFHSSLNTLCELGFNDSLILGTIGYNFSNNPQLPWQGDFTRFCNEENQISALCEDRNPNTQDDQIQEDCICQGKIIEDNCRTRDSLVLVSLYNATDGANWTNKWDLNQPMNTCFGVHLTAQGCVSALILHGNGDLTLEASEVGNNLSGTIPTSIGMLSEIRTLNIRESNLIGELPCELGELENLTGILLEDNQFSGGIPSSLGTIPALGTAGIGYLGLSNNQLSGCFPESLMALCDIQVETFGNSDLSWQGDFNRFCSGEVDLNCTLQSLNCDKDNCRTQDSLVLVALYNSTDGPNWTNSWDLNQPIDTWFGIKLNQNECVEEIKLCIDCRIENVRGNNLSGVLPPELGHLSEIERLEITYNPKLTGIIPPELGNLTTLVDLSLGFNSLSGNIPTELGQLNKLLYLTLNNNSLSGNIPSELGQISTLTLLYLYRNQLSGSLPNEIGQLENLIYLSLDNNDLSGSIPMYLGEFLSLNYLQLGNNNFSGCFPENLCPIVVDTLLNCSHFNNVLEGCQYYFRGNPLMPWQGDVARFCNGESQIGAPCDDGDSNTLNDKIQEDCSCQGSTMEEDCRTRDSIALVALYNSTDGANWTNKWDLNQSMNNWYGVTLDDNGCIMCIDMDGTPDCDVQNIQGADGNNLVGDLPDEIGNLENLMTLILSHNQLTGTIPSSIGNLSNLKDLRLIRNQFTGSIPEEIGNLSNLVTLWLNENQLSGNIPVPILQLPNLVELFLNDNQLQGSIPQELGSNQNLRFIALNNNDLSGCYPETILNNYLVACNDDPFTGNRQLPYQGEFIEFCLNFSFIDTNQFISNQFGLPCDDGNANTQDDKIQEDCNCTGTQINREDNTFCDCCSNNSFDLQPPVTNDNLSCSGDVFIPNFFQPNGTGIIDNFTIHFGGYDCVEAIDLVIYSTIDSSIIYQQMDIPRSNDDVIWNGFTNQGELASGNYYYEIIIKDGAGNSKFFGGRVCVYICYEKTMQQTPDFFDCWEFQSCRFSSQHDGKGGFDPSFAGASELIGEGDSCPVDVFTVYSDCQDVIRQGDSFCMDIKVTGFTDLLGMQFRLDWDKDVASYSNLVIDPSIENSINFSGTNIRFQPIEEQLRIGWASTDLDSGLSLADSSTLFQICFIAKSEGSPNFQIIDEPNQNSPIDIINSNRETLRFIENICDPEIISSTSLSSLCRTKDSLTLVTLYNATDGANWTNQWNLTQPIDTWYGIKLNQNGCVDEIRLCVDCLTDDASGNNLSGNLPEALGNLEDVQIIVIEHNVGLTGVIPTTIGNLKKTTFFSLSSNNLSGSIPNEIMDMSSLIDLRLGGNNLTGNIPPEIGQTPNLQHLFLDDNQLMGSIPDDLYNLDLIRLGLTDNQLTGSVSNRIGELQNLVLIRLRNNQFSGTIPTAIGGLTKLESLYLNDNDFSGCFPDELLNTCSLGFSIIDNEPGYNFTNNSQLPWQGDLERFCNGENQIGAICEDQDNTTINDQIQEDCSCTGSIMEEDCRTRDSLALVALYNATNGANWINKWNLSQAMDMWYGIELNSNGCVSILHLCEDCVCGPCDGNNLNGTLPNEIGDLSELTSFAIVNNPALIGSIPTSISKLQKVTFFSLEANGNISGILPIDIGNMTELRDLRIGLNRIGGDIPVSFYDLKNLHSIWGGPNELTGSLSERIAELPLINLAFGPNNFTGIIPDVFDSMPQLQRLLLEGNNFVGIIPSTLGALTALTHLNFSDNDLSGCFPESLRNLCSLQDCTDSKDCSIDFSNNPQLPWQGDFARFCNGENQIGAVCTDGNANTSEDQIQEDCSCLGEVCTEPMNLGRITEVEQLVTCDESIFLEDIASASTVATYETNPATVEVGISDAPGVVFDNLETGINTINIISDTFNCTYYTPTKIEVIRLTQPNLQEDRIGIDNTLSQHVFSVTENDDLIPNTRFTVEVVSPVSRGDLDNRRDGTFAYTPPANFTGVANFDYRLCYDDCMTYCDRATVLLDVSGEGLNEDGFTVPEAFTPNDDGVNDEFIIPALRDEPEKYPKNELIVINRWGDQVFYAKPYNNDWRGTNEKGKPLPAATYYYILRLDLAEGDIVRGEVTLIR